MAGMNFDQLRQGLEALENLGMQAVQNASGTAQTAPEPAAQGQDNAPPPMGQPSPAPNDETPAQLKIQQTPVPKPEISEPRPQQKHAVHARQLRRAIILSEILAPPLSQRRK